MKIKLNPNNPRIIKDDKFKKLVQSIKDFPEMLDIRPIVVNKEGIILGGNMRYKACIEAGIKEPPHVVVDLTDEQQKEFLIKDNVSGGEWDWDVLANEWNVEQLDSWGLDMPSVEVELLESEEDKKTEAIQKLEDKFIVPPFSILNTREGYWQERKKYWNILIGDNGESRDNIESKVNATVTNWDNKPYKGGVIKENSISILDSVLAEISNKWFGLKNCKTFDCFAGDSVFGYVSSYLGNSFTGIELRQEQADLNNERIKGFNSKYICDDGRNILNHIEENSQDLLFSCPPYFDLEVYSDLTNDASNQKDYKDFINILDTAFSNAIKCLKENRFAVIVCGDVRDKKGNYFRFPDDIKDIFIKNEMKLYNELILIQSVGNGALRANRYMGSRKVVKMHEQVLVFYKGDSKEIKNIYPKILIEDESKDVE
jgi:DNA modification methylase